MPVLYCRHKGFHLGSRVDIFRTLDHAVLSVNGKAREAEKRCRMLCECHREARWEPTFIYIFKFIIKAVHVFVLSDFVRRENKKLPCGIFPAREFFDT